MSIKDIRENYPTIYKNCDKQALSWIMKNKKLLTSEFKQAFPKSPYKFVAQLGTKNGSCLINDNGDIKKTANVAFLNIAKLESLGCPLTVK